jgi:SAM-dependent methyltransferase
MTSVRVVTVPDATEEYVAFGNMESRNGLQERIEIPLMIRALGLTQGLRILEVGCGRGIALPVLTDRLAPRDLTAIDVDPALVEIARQRATACGITAEVIHGDVRAMPFASSRFDMVVDFGTCYHVSGGRAGAARALSEIRRVLAPRGVLVHATPIAQHLAHPIRSFARSLPWKGAGFRLIRTAGLWSVRERG